MLKVAVSIKEELKTKVMKLLRFGLHKILSFYLRETGLFFNLTKACMKNTLKYILARIKKGQK